MCLNSHCLRDYPRAGKSPGHKINFVLHFFFLLEMSSAKSMLSASNPNNSSGTWGVIRQGRQFNPAFCLKLKMREMPLDPNLPVLCAVSFQP